MADTQEKCEEYCGTSQSMRCVLDKWHSGPIHVWHDPENVVECIVVWGVVDGDALGDLELGPTVVEPVGSRRRW